ncbi:methyltransferase domain-containing protein [Teredinibacter haidensis]|uniref:methyltransferase domain-containing protein n=1 Tax=Teredinibacter haidensis TaxID=2731755 RepID=UPI000948F161|nr:methyltransferase domain-containing protein [Teredinibacter haidensis]
MKTKQSIKPLHQTIAQIAKWYESPLGQSILAAQQQVLNEELSCLFGYHLMQLSVLPYHRLSESSRINHCFSLAPAVVHSKQAAQNLCDLQGMAELDALPLADESIDVTILHHVLEFSNNPHQVLKEAARVTVPRGHIVIFGFNPLSLLGLLQLGAQFYSRKVIWKRRALRAGRLKDWLEFLDFSCLQLKYLSHNLPINHARYLHHSRFLSRGLNSTLPFGSTFCMVARKDKVGLTPLKPEWEAAAPLLGASPLPKRSMTARSGESALILPLRRRNNIQTKR